MSESSNDLTKALATLVADLDRVARGTFEMCRDEVREELTAAIVDGFIERVDGFRVAEQLGMSSVGANSAAGAAIDRFLKHARQIAGSSDLSSVEGRLRGFQKRVVVGPFRWSRESFFRDFEDVEQMRSWRRERAATCGRAERLRTRIPTPFEGLRPPPGRRILRRPRSGDPEEAILRRKLKGKRRDDLGFPFLQEWWAGFCYLSAEAFRYYLPALLDTSLYAFPSRGPLIHSAISLLTPSYWRLHYAGADDDFDEWVAALDPAQYDVVCEFLEFVHEEVPRYRFPSAKAIRWGWSSRESSALAKARAFYHRLHNHEYSPSADTRVQRVVDEIETAFESTPYPGDDRLCGSDLGDEPSEYALEFRGHSWRKLHPEFLGWHSAALSFLSDDGFRYYVPAFMMADLLCPECECDPIFELTHDVTGHRERFARFNGRERRAIVAYLRYAAEDDEYSRESIERALELYWIPTAQG